jgi:transposase
VQEAFITKIEQYVSDAREGKLVVLFHDPMHQIHNNENAYCWQEMGKAGTIQIRANSGRRRLNIMGALNPLTLRPTIFLSEENCDKEMMKVFLQEIRSEYPRPQPIVIILDNARYQRAYEVQEEAKRLGITLEFLPPYAPNLNLIERLWKYFKKKMMQNSYHPTFDDFFTKTVEFFRTIESRRLDLETLLTLKFEIIKAC